ncbi:MAG: hypothetical protein AAF438_06650 [Pseudomonadota bacterium]
MTRTLKYASLKYHQARDHLQQSGTIHERLVKAISVAAQVRPRELPDTFQSEVSVLIKVVGSETWRMAQAGEHIETRVRTMNLVQCQMCSRTLLRLGDHIDQECSKELVD